MIILFTLQLMFTDRVETNDVRNPNREPLQRLEDHLILLE